MQLKRCRLFYALDSTRLDATEQRIAILEDGVSVYIEGTIMPIHRKLAASLKQMVKRLIFTPPGVRVGLGASIRRPWTIHGPSRIEIGARTTILRGAYLNAVERYAGVAHQPHIQIGDDVYIGRYCYLTAMDSITIETGCVLSEHVYITDLSHGFDPAAGLIMLQPLTTKGPVRIGAHTFLGYRVSVMQGVTLGDHCIVGADSVVTRSFPSFSMIAGNPAKLIKTYSVDKRSWELALREGSHA